MERTSTWAVLIQGYADIQGPVEYNRLLAQRRAETVKQFLVELGVPETSIKIVTIGKEGALCDDPSRECQQLNRRVHLEIRKMVRAAPAPVRPQIAVGDALETSLGCDAGERTAMTLARLVMLLVLLQLPPAGFPPAAVGAADPAAVVRAGSPKARCSGRRGRGRSPRPCSPPMWRSG